MDTSLPDPTDWLRTPLHPLSALDASLRCQVCKDFYTNPVITSCSHTFCSLCIRRCLSAEGKCPTCRADDQEVRLRQNWALGEVVESFQAARAEVLKFATEAERRKENESEESGIRTLKKRKLGEVEGEELEGSPRRTRSRSARQTENTDGTPVVIENSQDEEYEPDDGLVACPICRRRMKEESVFLHLNHCTGAPAKKEQRQPHGLFSSPRKNASQQQERLPTINYSLMKENVLRKKLRDLGIPDWGAKSLLQRRHTEWVNLNNANCDSKNPKSKKELLKELDLWERSQGGQAILYHRDQTPSVMRKDFDGGAWSAAHGGDFKKLIENARKGRDAETRPASSEPAPAPASVLVPTPGPVPTPTAISTSAESPPSAAEDSGNPQTATPTAAVVEPQATPDNPTISERSDKAELSCRKPAESDSAPPALEGQRQRFVVEDAAA